MKEKQEINEMIDMPIHTFVELEDGTEVHRVPGGWNYVYLNVGAVAFVPFPKGTMRAEF